jgi:hypothetical protein
MRMTLSDNETVGKNGAANLVVAYRDLAALRSDEEDLCSCGNADIGGRRRQVRIGATQQRFPEHHQLVSGPKRISKRRRVPRNSTNQLSYV